MIASFAGLVITVIPSYAILSSTYSMPAALQAAASSSLILRDASEMSVSPAQKRLKPSPVPGPSIVGLKSGFDAMNASATPVEMGSTVDEPETLIEPEIPPPVGAEAAGDSPAPAEADGLALAPPPQAATAKAATRASAPMRFVDVIVTG